MLSCFEPSASLLSPRRWLALTRACSLSSIPVGTCSSLILPQNWGLYIQSSLAFPEGLQLWLWWGQGHTLEGIFSFPSGAGVVGLMTIQYHREVGCVWDDEDWVLGFRVKGSVT